MILAIDQGTTGTTCIVFDEQGSIVGRSYRELEQHYPKPGWVEHDAAEIWDVSKAVADEALADAKVEGADLHAIGIANQRETAVAWDRRSGAPLHRAIVWQDRRTVPRCEELKAAGEEDRFRERTGLVLDAYFSGTKYEWLIDEAGVDQDRAAFGTIDSWLVHKLTGEHITDYTNASRSLLFDIRTLRWDPELCEVFGVPVDALPEVLPSAHVYGETSEFGGRVPVAGIAGDQQAALFGQACREEGQVKSTYGTGSFILQPYREMPPVQGGLISTVAWGLEGRVDYAIEGSTFVTGAAIQWLRDGLGIVQQAAETEELARSLESNEGVYFVPALAGLGSPYWDGRARGTIVGLTRGSGRAHLARAALEAMAYQCADIVERQDELLGHKLDELRADGGAVANEWLMQFQADILGAPVVVPEITETTALGAAYLAGIATDLYTEEGTRAMWREAKRYEPRMSEDERASLLHDWRRAVGRAQGWVED